jgi:tyrosyl-tRNA synthetase
MYRYYELLTDVPMSQIEDWKREAAEGKINPRDLKAELAKSIIKDFWSQKEAEEAAEEFDRIHKRREVPTSISAAVVIHSQPFFTGEAQVMRPLLNIMMELRIFPSRGEAKRVIQQGGVYLDGQRIDDINYQIDITDSQEHVLRVGKRKFYKFIFK